VKVLYLNPCARMGGAETSLVELLASIRAAEPAWELALLLAGEGPLESRARSLGISVRVVPMPAALAKMGDSGSPGGLAMLEAIPAVADYLLRLKRAIRQEEPDLIHSTGFKMHGLSAQTRPRGVPLIWHIHDYVQPRPMMSRLLRWHRRRCTQVIVNSRSVAADVRAALGRRARIETIYNAIDLCRFSPVGSELDLDALSGLPAAEPGTVRVGLVGTFARWKGHHTFLKALSRLQPATGMRAYVIGGPIYETAGSQHTLGELRLEAARLGLKGRVGFTGFVEDTASAMRALDVVVHASTEPEPFGMVIAEGMACGKAVIASQAGGAAEIFENGVDALGHTPGDAAMLADSIALLARDEALRTRLGRAGRAKVEVQFSRERLGRELVAVYRRYIQDALVVRPEVVAAHG
jgi:glycosyltransferase involved in cell wall biosynthesis